MASNSWGGAVEDAIRATLEGELGYPVIGEERGGQARYGEPYWLLDPICGTRNFASGLRLFAINLAMVENEEVTVGVVGDGGSGNTHVAELGRGASTVVDGTNALRLRANPESRVIYFEAWPAHGPARDRAAIEFSVS